MIRVLISPDKFKGTLNATEAARAMRMGLRRSRPNVQCTIQPLSDGGEGFVETLVRATGGSFHYALTTNAIGDRRRVRWGALGDGTTAVVGLTEASALADVPEEKRDPGLTSNVGTGEIIARAVAKGYRRIIIGLGGSATNDGGIGLVAPLGYRFLDARGQEIALNGEGLAKLARIEEPELPGDVEIVVATDVAHPLHGSRGAAHVFAPQKGATPEQVKRLDANLKRLARVAAKSLKRSHHAEPGAGAAGGCGYGLMTFLHARCEPGFELIRQALDLDRLVREHDLVVTGEGCLDASSLEGKAPVSLGRLCERLKTPCWAFAGRVDPPRKGLPFERVRGIVSDSVPAELALAKPWWSLCNTVAEAARDWPLPAARRGRRAS